MILKNTYTQTSSKYRIRAEAWGITVELNEPKNTTQMTLDKSF